MQPLLFDNATWLDYLKGDLLPRVLAEVRERRQELRIWSVGCQTGDEAAVLALALHTLLGDEMADWRIRIFATDPDTLATVRARQRMYPERPDGGKWWREELPAFESTVEGYRLAKALRNTIIFAPHDLLSQPPFLNLDLIVCHIPLASWSLDKQITVLNRFAYALAAQQYLWQVAPGNLPFHPSYWLCLDTSSRLYRRTCNTIPLKSLQWKRTPAHLETASSSEPLADLYMEELQASLEEREVAYQELEQRMGDLEQANQELARLNRLKMDFLSMASHELRTPLTSMLGYGELLRMVLAQAGPSPASGTAGRSPIEMIDKMLAQGTLMTTLIRDLLDVSRLHADVFAVGERHMCNVVELVSRVAEQQAAQADRLISVVSEPQALLGDWDEGRIEQVLTNLLTNALKFSEAQTTVTLSVQGDSPGGAAKSVLITVRDQGCGISQEHQEHLFECFYRVRTEDNRAVEGLGLGLYIAAEIVKRHGGYIWVESTRGVGSTFFVRLPLGKRA